MRISKWLVPALYIFFLMLPIYWLVSMSFKTTNEILGGFSLFPQNFTTENYVKIFTDPTWYWGYINSLAYVSMNTVISVAVALPAAYAFSRYRFLGDKHLFFWLLTNRMAPVAILAALFVDWSIRFLFGRRTCTHVVQHPACCVDFGRLHVRRP
jgi:glycerol transport system permease protein